MFRSLIEKLRLERLRWLWTQCDLFDGPDVRDVQTIPQQPDRSYLAAPATKRPPVPPALPVRPDRGSGEKPAWEQAEQAGRRTQRTHRDDRAFVERLVRAHAEYNDSLFGGRLNSVQIRISRRMKNRLGHYMAAGNGMAAEIAMSRKHIARDAWDDVLHTLVHEMVHQWQDENGHALDHGQSFRRKAREVGISARATRPAAAGSQTPGSQVPGSQASSSQPRLAARAMHRPNA